MGADSAPYLADPSTPSCGLMPSSVQLTRFPNPTQTPYFSSLGPIVSWCAFSPRGPSLRIAPSVGQPSGCSAWGKLDENGTDWLRLIFDCMQVNWMCRVPPKAHLATPGALANFNLSAESLGSGAVGAERPYRGVQSSIDFVDAFYRGGRCSATLACPAPRCCPGWPTRWQPAGSSGGS